MSAENIDLRSLIENEKNDRHREMRELEDKLRSRVHEALNATSKIEGMVTEVRVSSNERHARLEEQQRQTRDEVASINVKLDTLRDVIDTKLESVRISFNSELREVRNSLTDMKVAISKIDVKTVGIIGGIVIAANFATRFFVL